VADDAQLRLTVQTCSAPVKMHGKHQALAQVGASFGAHRAGHLKGCHLSSHMPLQCASAVGTVFSDGFACISSPSLQVGGHAMPVAGKIGGAKGIGLADDPKVGGAAITRVYWG
jgi:hypothetical protein